ncbi:MAG: alkaline phosphatase family protein, partial [Actinobacteria bacterium]|nr:alkaline phosphatase family protein [Actinomycetota bacterium]
AVFPSVTPVCASSIATGVAQDRHLIPSMNWYHRGERRYVEYGSSLRASWRAGFARQLTDLIYNMNRAHLSAEAPTVFESLDDSDIRTACTTYLIYRGRHRHEPSLETAMTRFASKVLMRHPVMGARELFYADIFASRETDCRGQLGMPGVRDQHSGCVAVHLVEHDLFDFLLLSLPDNDAHSHKYGPHAQVDSIAEADRQMARMMEAGGGPEQFLEDHAMIVVADHSHGAVERSIPLADEFSDFAVMRPVDPRPDEAEIALCPAQRSAMIYLLRDEPALRREVVTRARSIPGVDLVMWREESAKHGPQAVLAGERGELRFGPGGRLADPRGRRWRVSGELETIEAQHDGGVLRSEHYPDALGRTWDALACQTSGEVLFSAAPAYEFCDWGGAHHVGGGSHGSLHASDSLAPLICAGLHGEVRREQWSIKDVAALVRAHFALRPPAARPRARPAKVATGGAPD